MLCQNCKKNDANVHFTKIINNKKLELFLCRECAEETGQINMISPININEFFTGLLGFDNNTSEINSVRPRRIACKKCGMSFEEFQKIGKLGCDECYMVFEDKLKPLLKRLHGDVQHNGKMPYHEATSTPIKNANTKESSNTTRASNASKVPKESNKIEVLKEQLNEAIKNEEYEKAAEIRDKIKAIEK